MLAVTAEEPQYSANCARCDCDVKQAAAIAYTAFETIDLEWADPNKPGISLTNTKHTYYETVCACGHRTQRAPHRQVSHNSTPDIWLSEWRLVGPGLAALIVCLAYRMRLSRVRIQEFLSDWLGLEISVGTLHATLHESGAAVLPVEEELVAAVQSSGLLHVDESVPRRRAQKVKVLQCSHAAQEMRVGPSDSPYRRRLQTTYCCGV